MSFKQINRLTFFSFFFISVGVRCFSLKTTRQINKYNAPSNKIGIEKKKKEEKVIPIICFFKSFYVSLGGGIGNLQARQARCDIYLYYLSVSPSLSLTDLM